MANFATHAVAGAVLASCVSVGGWISGALTLPGSLLVGAATWIASLAPDLDARSSVPARWLWDGLALSLSLWWLVSFGRSTPGPERWFAAALMGLFIRGPLSRWVMKATRHRGLWHSVQAALILASVAGLALRTLTTISSRTQLWVAAATTGGYLLHLILDEAFSVDLNNARLRRSFGSALKLWDKRAPKQSWLLTCLALLGSGVFLLGLS